VDTGAALPLVFIGAGVLLGGLFLFYFYHSWQTQLNDENKRIQQLQAQKTDPGADQAAGGSVRQAESGAAATGEYDRAVAAGPHRGAGTSGPGCQHSFASREPFGNIGTLEP